MNKRLRSTIGCIVVGFLLFSTHSLVHAYPIATSDQTNGSLQGVLPNSLVTSILKAIIATVIVSLAFWITSKVFSFIKNQVARWQDQRLDSVRFQRLVFLSNRQIDRIIDVVFFCIRAIIYLIIFYIYFQFILGAFPATAPIAEKLIDAFWAALGSVWRGFLGYLPNLVTIVVFLFIAYWAVRLSRFIFTAIGRGTITIPGFYREWADPTSSIATFLICALAVVLIFPLLPAADSPSFQGISIFIGALLTLGSSTAINNIISGYISIYTRAFQEGDRIEVNGIVGEVIDKTILSTQILTPDNEVVTIPNASIISSNITNYASSNRNLQKPLIIKTTVTLGYDVPWRQVYEVLIEAALATEDILADPKPFVWQTSLDDYYPSYCLKAYTKKSNRLGALYSHLHENIQDKCNEAGIEILSPLYAAVRDGNVTTIPNNYLPENYNAPGFKLESQHSNNDSKQ